MTGFGNARELVTKILTAAFFITRNKCGNTAQGEHRRTREGINRLLRTQHHLAFNWWYAVVWDFSPTTARWPLMGFFVPCCSSSCRGIFQSHERGTKCRGIKNPIKELFERIKVVGFFFHFILNYNYECDVFEHSFYVFSLHKHEKHVITDDNCWSYALWKHGIQEEARRKLELSF